MNSFFNFDSTQRLRDIKASFFITIQSKRKLGDKTLSSFEVFVQIMKMEVNKGTKNKTNYNIPFKSFTF